MKKISEYLDEAADNPLIIPDCTIFIGEQDNGKPFRACALGALYYQARHTTETPYHRLSFHAIFEATALEYCGVDLDDRIMHDTSYGSDYESLYRVIQEVFESSGSDFRATAAYLRERGY